MGKWKEPVLGENVYVAPGAVVIGDVILGDHVNIWFHAVIRADTGKIRIGNNTNIQDNCVLHVDFQADVKIGADVTVGHGAIVHGCTVGDNTLIGMGAIILNHAVIGKNCIVGAGALVPEGRVIPDNSLVVGSPARIVRSVTAEEILGIKHNAEHYVKAAAEYAEEEKERLANA